MGCSQQVEALESQFAARMETLKNTVQSKTAVPTAQVYVSILQWNWMFFILRELCNVTLQCYNIDWRFALSNLQLVIRIYWAIR